MGDFAETNTELQRDKLTAELKEQEAQLLSRTQALKAVQAELASSEKALQAAQEQREETQRAEEAAREELHRLQKQEAALQKELAGVFALAFGKKRTLRDSIHKTQQHLEAAQKRLDEAQARLAEQSAETERLSLQLQGLKTNAAARQAALEEAKAAEKQARRDAEEEAARKAAEEQARRAAAEEAKRKAAEEQARRAAAEKAAQKQIKQPRGTPLENTIQRLEKLYPEHKIFALSAIDDDLRDRFTKLCREAGYDTVEELFTAYGFEQIGGDAVKALRDSVIYTPGNEPDIIKNKIDSILRRLEEYYPGHVIVRAVEADHKQLGNNISGLYRWLGYPNIASFFTAYGYTYQVTAGGRPVNDFQPMLDALTEKYRTQPKPRAMGTLLFENPEYKGQLKTLQNKSQKLFGMPLKKYFQQLGIIAQTASSAVPQEKTAGPF